MNKNKLPLLYLVLSLLLIVSCRDQPKRMPDTLPDVRGYIDEIKRTNTNGSAVKAVIMVKKIEGLETDYPDASVRIDENTLIEDATGKVLKLEQLREGHEVQAWFEGGISESMPVQGYAKAMRVEY